MIDHELTRSIQAWVESPADTRDVETGALFLLQLTRNQWLYKVACLYPQRYAAVVEQELRKHLRIRLAGLTTEEVARQEPEVRQAAAETLTEHTAAHRGKRPDHEQLPERIQRLYDRNGEIYQKMKAAFNTLQELEQGTPCDRYEHVQILRELDTKYRANWATYDSYDPASDRAAEELEALKADPAAAARAINAARRVISAHLPEVGKADPDRAEALRDKLQDQAELVVSLGGSFSPRQAERLRQAGIALE